jgi:hypothetical protein
MVNLFLDGTAQAVALAAGSQRMRPGRRRARSCGRDRTGISGFGRAGGARAAVDGDGERPCARCARNPHEPGSERARFDVAPGEKLTIAVTITVPARTEMTKFFLGITRDVAGIGPHGPIGMEPILATASHLTPGPYNSPCPGRCPGRGARRRLPPGHGSVVAGGDQERAAGRRGPCG